MVIGSGVKRGSNYSEEAAFSIYLGWLMLKSFQLQLQTNLTTELQLVLRVKVVDNQLAFEVNLFSIVVPIVNGTNHNELCSRS